MDYKVGRSSSSIYELTTAFGVNSCTVRASGRSLMFIFLDRIDGGLELASNLQIVGQMDEYLSLPNRMNLHCSPRL